MWLCVCVWLLHTQLKPFVAENIIGLDISMDHMLLYPNQNVIYLACVSTTGEYISEVMHGAMYTHMYKKACMCMCGYWISTQVDTGQDIQRFQ